MSIFSLVGTKDEICKIQVQYKNTKYMCIYRGVDFVPDCLFLFPICDYFFGFDYLSLNYDSLLSFIEVSFYQSQYYVDVLLFLNLSF